MTYEFLERLVILNGLQDDHMKVVDDYCCHIALLSALLTGAFNTLNDPEFLCREIIMYFNTTGWARTNSRTEKWIGTQLYCA